MKFLKKLIMAVLIAIILLVIALYLLMQTRWGAGAISSLITKNSRWSLTFSHMEHRWSAPAHFTFKNVTFGRKSQPAILTAQTMDIGLNRHAFTRPHRVESLLLEDGALHLSQTAFPVSADTLRLKSMALDNMQGISAQNVTGGISPWHPQANSITGHQAQLKFSAGTLTFGDITVNNALLQGRIDNGRIDLPTLGADIGRGTLTASLSRNQKGHWQVKNLRLNEIRLQSNKSLPSLFSTVATLPDMTIDRLDIINARLEGTGWAMTDLDLSLRALTLENGRWHSTDGTLSMNASDIIWGRLHLEEPMMDADLTPQGVTLRQFNSRLERGIVRASGAWRRDSRTLAINTLTLAGLEYTLVQNWKARWLKPLPAWLSNVTVEHFSASRNLLIDINPAFPFQFTALDASGQRLQLAQNGKWGLWAGTLNLNADSATLNRTDIRRPSLQLMATSDAIHLATFSTFVGTGLLEARGDVSQQPQRMFTLNVTGKSVPLDVFSQWGWPAHTTPGISEENGNVQLDIKGSLEANVPLKTTVSGALQATRQQGLTLRQTMEKGNIVTGDNTGTENTAQKSPDNADVDVTL